MWRRKQVKRKLIKITVKDKEKERNMQKLFMESMLKVRFCLTKGTSTVKSVIITVTVKLWKSKKRNSVKEIRSERAKRKLLKKRKRSFILHGRQARKRKLKIKFISLKERKLHLILTQNKIYEKKFTQFFYFIELPTSTWKNGISNICFPIVVFL